MISNSPTEFGQPPLLAIGLGTSKVAVQTCGSESVDSVPFVAAFDKRRRGLEGANYCLGDTVKPVPGRSPAGIEVVRPMAAGAGGNFGAAVAVASVLRTLDRNFLAECLSAAGITRRIPVASHMAALARGVPDCRDRHGTCAAEAT